MRESSAYWIRFLNESIDKYAEQLVSIVDLIRVFSDDPNERCLRLRFVELVEVSAQRGDDTFVGGRIFPEDVLVPPAVSLPHHIYVAIRTHLHNHNGLLHHIRDPGTNQVE